MQVKLRVMQGAQAGREVIIPVAEFLIGRGEECHLRPRSDAISRRHCAIVVTDRQVTVRDLGSKNGLFVNGERVEDSRVVESGDRFQVGPLQFEFVIEHVLGASKRPAARDVKEVAARTAAGSNDDLDIARWLEEADDTDVSRAMATPETRQFRIDDTHDVALMADSEQQAEGSGEMTEDIGHDEEDPADETSESGKQGRKPAKKTPGKLPPRSSLQCKDSRDAAAEMLKRFFNRG
jgi:pSer/pThr/pTyr-binding forkhead associated (FHA) protein